MEDAPVDRRADQEPWPRLAVGLTAFAACLCGGALALIALRGSAILLDLPGTIYALCF